MSASGPPALRCTRMKRVCLLSLLVLTGCGGSSGRSVSLRVSEVLSDGTTKPVQAAHVRLIPLDTGVVPLPITGRTLDELGGSVKDVSGFTNSAGRLTLKAAERPLAVEVNWPIFEKDGGEHAGDRGWRGWLNASRDQLRIDGDPGAMRVDLIK